jgi:hypothetical protein
MEYSIFTRLTLRQTLFSLSYCGIFMLFTLTIVWGMYATCRILSTLALAGNGMPVYMCPPTLNRYDAPVDCCDITPVIDAADVRGHRHISGRGRFHCALSSSRQHLGCIQEKRQPEELWKEEIAYLASTNS